MKICLGCKISKSLTEFHHCKTSKDGRKSRCKECRNRDNGKYRKKEKITKLHSEKLAEPIFETITNEKFCKCCGENSDFSTPNELNICNTCYSNQKTREKINFPAVFILIKVDFKEIKSLLEKKNIRTIKIQCVKEISTSRYSLEVSHNNNLLYFGYDYDLNQLTRKAMMSISKIKNYDYDSWDNLNN